MAKNTIKVANKNGKFVSDYFGVPDSAFKYATTKMAAGLTAAVLSPFNKTKGEVALEVIKELANDKNGFKVKDMNSAFVMGMAFSLGLRMKQDLLDAFEKSEKKSEDVAKPSGPDIVTRMAEHDFEEIRKGISMIGEHIVKLERQKVIN